MLKNSFQLLTALILIALSNAFTHKAYADIRPKVIVRVKCDGLYKHPLTAAGLGDAVYVPRTPLTPNHADPIKSSRDIDLPLWKKMLARAGFISLTVERNPELVSKLLANWHAKSSLLSTIQDSTEKARRTHQLTEELKSNIDDPYGSFFVHQPKVSEIMEFTDILTKTLLSKEPVPLGYPIFIVWYRVYHRLITYITQPSIFEKLGDTNITLQLKIANDVHKRFQELDKDRAYLISSLISLMHSKVEQRNQKSKLNSITQQIDQMVDTPDSIMATLSGLMKLFEFDETGVTTTLTPRELVVMSELLAKKLAGFRSTADEEIYDYYRSLVNWTRMDIYFKTEEYKDTEEGQNLRSSLSFLERGHDEQGNIEFIVNTYTVTP